MEGLEVSVARRVTRIYPRGSRSLLLDRFVDLGPMRLVLSFRSLLPVFENIISLGFSPGTAPYMYS